MGQIRERCGLGKDHLVGLGVEIVQRLFLSLGRLRSLTQMKNPSVSLCGDERKVSQSQQKVWVWVFLCPLLITSYLIGTFSAAPGHLLGLSRETNF